MGGSTESGAAREPSPVQGTRPWQLNRYGQTASADNVPELSAMRRSPELNQLF